MMFIVTTNVRSFQGVTAATSSAAGRGLSDPALVVHPFSSGTTSIAPPSVQRLWVRQPARVIRSRSHWTIHGGSSDSSPSALRRRSASSASPLNRFVPLRHSQSQQPQESPLGNRELRMRAAARPLESQAVKNSHLVLLVALLVLVSGSCGGFPPEPIPVSAFADTIQATSCSDDAARAVFEDLTTCWDLVESTGVERDDNSGAWVLHIGVTDVIANPLTPSSNFRATLCVNWPPMSGPIGLYWTVPMASPSDGMLGRRLATWPAPRMRQRFERAPRRASARYRREMSWYRS